MKNDNDEFETMRCSLCGDLKGHGIDHSECSKIKQAMYKDVVRPKAKKKLNKAGINYLSKTY